MLDIATAEEVKIIVGAAGQLWINVEGICMVRIQYCENICIDDSREDNGKP